jgi:hypothetical protein
VMCPAPRSGLARICSFAQSSGWNGVGIVGHGAWGVGRGQNAADGALLQMPGMSREQGWSGWSGRCAAVQRRFAVVQIFPLNACCLVSLSRRLTAGFGIALALTLALASTVALARAGSLWIQCRGWYEIRDRS